jgi:cytochrome c oxidase subunit 2
MNPPQGQPAPHALGWPEQGSGPWAWSPFDAASKGGQATDRLFLFCLGACAVILLLVFVLVVYYGLKYRAGSGADRSNPIRRVRRVEIAEIAVLGLAFGAMFTWGAGVYYEREAPPASARTIFVAGKQWMWKAEHEGGIREIDALHVPLGEPVRLVLSSQDVIHSFYIPAFRIKQDAVPGRYTTLWFTPTRPGRYPFFCAEYCGAEHSAMGGWVSVLPPESFASWLNASAPGPVPGTPGTRTSPLLRGRGLFFRLGCNACHTAGDAVRAPRLDGIFGRTITLDSGEVITADENYIRESILDPNARIAAGYPRPSLMPTYQGAVSQDELRELVEFIRSLQHGWPPAEAAP